MGHYNSKLFFLTLYNYKRCIFITNVIFYEYRKYYILWKLTFIFYTLQYCCTMVFISVVYVTCKI